MIRRKIITRIEANYSQTTWYQNVQECHGYTIFYLLVGHCFTCK